MNIARPLRRLFGFPVLGLLLGLAVTRPSEAEIYINAGNFVAPQTEYFGWDLKGSVGLAGTLSRAQTHYAETGANVVRIPVFANAHAESGTVDASQYTTMLRSIRNIQAVTRDVKIFASLKLDGANTFPSWIETNNNGTIFSNNVKRPDPSKYSQLLTEFVKYMTSKGVKIAFFGINNETDNAILANECVSTISQLRTKLVQQRVATEYRDFKWVAGETYRAAPAAGYVESVITEGGGDMVDIGGAHMYPKVVVAANAWVNLGNVLPAAPARWHTEVHVKSQSAFPDTSNTRLLRDAASVLFGSNRDGVTGFVWWQPADGDTSVTSLIKRELTQIMMSGRAVETTPGFNIQTEGTNDDVYQAFVHDDFMDIVLFNRDGWDSNLHVTLEDLLIGEFSIVDVYQGPGTALVTDPNDTDDPAYATGAKLRTISETIDQDRTRFTLAGLRSDSTTRLQLSRLVIAVPDPGSTFAGMVVVAGLYLQRRRF